MYLLNPSWKVGIDKIIYLKDSKQNEFVEENIVFLAVENSFSSIVA